MSGKIINCDIYGTGNGGVASFNTGLFVSNCRIFGDCFGSIDPIPLLGIIQYTSGLPDSVTNGFAKVSFCTLTNNVVIPNK